MPREAMLAKTIVQLADTLVAEFDVAARLTLLVDSCVDLLDVGDAGITLVTADGDLRVMTFSSEAMRMLELYELHVQEGPCLDCYRSGQPVVNEDLATVNGPWPRFAAAALAAGYHSVHAVPMRLRGTVIGVVNMFRTEPGAMRLADAEAAQALADVTTITILQYRATLEAQTLNDQLNHALSSRIVIEQAKGMVAERRGCTMEQAFGLLRRYARNNNVRLNDVAQNVISGMLVTTELERPSATQRKRRRTGTAGVTVARHRQEPGRLRNTPHEPDHGRHPGNAASRS